jgi:yecA family protein
MKGDTEYQDCMDQLRILLQQHPISRSFNEAHGFVTAAAVAGDIIEEAPWRQTLLDMEPSMDLDDISDDMYECLEDAVFYLQEQLQEPEFTPLVSSETIQNTKLPKTQEWAKGFLDCISLVTEDWDTLLAASSVESVRQMLALNVIADPQQYASLLFSPDVDTGSEQFLQETRAMAGPIASSLYLKVSRLDHDTDELRDEIEHVLQLHASQDPQSLTDEQLFGLITSTNDTLSLQAVEECVQRQDTLFEWMATYLHDEHNWQDDADEAHWWALVHCVFILGKMTGPAAANALLDVMQRKTGDDYNDLWDWVDEYWPALLANKMDFAQGRLRQLAQDASFPASERYHIFQCLLAGSQDRPQELDNTLDFLADNLQALPKDEEARFLLADLLMNFPRARHRSMLDRLAKEQRKMPFKYFDAQDIHEAFDRGDYPQWERFSDPWWFYQPGQIAQRQLRWRREDATGQGLIDDEFYDVGEGSYPYGSLDEEDLFAQEFGDKYEYQPETYVREMPKVGRNDLCPCGSGKKYKKCCLH